MPIHYLDVVFYRAFTEIKTEIYSQWLGLLWWILEPLLYMGVFYIIFAILGLRGGGDIVPFLLVGLVPWKWFAASVYTGSVSIKRAAALIQQIYVPKYVFLCVSVLTSLMRFIVVLSLLLLFLVFYGYQVTPAWLDLLPVIFVQGLLVFGVAGLFAALIPFVEDLLILVTNGLTLMFFLSGIFFDISKAPASLLPYIYLNPMVTLIEAYREVLLEGREPNWLALLGVGAFAFALTMAALYLLRRFDRHYPKVLSL